MSEANQLVETAEGPSAEALRRAGSVLREIALRIAQEESDDDE